MHYRRLGQTGLKVSEISLGSWLTYGNAVADDTAVNTIRQAYDLGINFFDTANAYNRGESEKVVGAALKKYERSSYVLATKVFFPMGGGPNDRGLSRKHIMEQAHASLKRLDHDYIDIYYCHRHDPETPVTETLRALDDLIRQGKILYAGVSEWSAAQIEEAVRVADKYLLDRIAVNQPKYNMLHRRIEGEILPVSQKYGIGQVVFSPLAQGLLTGKYKTLSDIPQDSRAANDKVNGTMASVMNEENLLKVQKLGVIAGDLGLGLSQLALAWILRLPGISSALTGASRPEQVIQNAKASEIRLGEEVLQKIETVLQ